MNVAQRIRKNRADEIANICSLTGNGWLVLQPVLFHVFDSVFGETVCPEKVASSTFSVELVLRPPSPFILSPRRGNNFRLFPVLRMSIRPIQLYEFSKERRTILPLLGERAGVGTGHRHR